MAAAAAIVEVLRGNEPVMPPALTLPASVRDAVPDDVVDKAAWLEQQWGWLAFAWWCRLTLSTGQRETLLRQHFDLNELGNDFFRYLICDTNSTGETLRPPASYILASAHPAAVLKEWFGRFLVSSSSPFEQTISWKLKQRFDDVLRGDARFSRVGEQWNLVVRDRPLANSPDVRQETLNEHLNRTIGRLKPLLYGENRADDPPEDRDPVVVGDESSDRKERKDPVIRKEDVLRVAQAAIVFAGPTSSWDLALACRELFPEGLWCEISREQTPEGSSEDASEVAQKRGGGNKPEEIRAEPDTNEDQGEANPSFDPAVVAVLAQEAWNNLSRSDRIVAAARLFQYPPWTFQRIEDWTRTNLQPEFLLKLKRAHEHAGKDDTLIKARIAATIPPPLRENDSRNALEVFLRSMAEEARKMLALPPSHGVNDEPQERRPPAHE